MPRGQWKQARRLAACVFALLLAPGALAAEVAVLLSQAAEPYASFYNALVANLPPQSGVLLNRVGDGSAPLNGEELSRASLIVTVGVAATETALRANGRAILAVLVPRDDLETFRARYPKARLGGIFLDPPPERQLQLLQLALPHARTVGVLVGPDSARSTSLLEQAAASAGLGLRIERIARPDEVVPGLERLLADADVLLAVPDNLVFNRNTALSILLTSYRLGRPVLAFSKAYVTAGALVATYSTPEGLGRQVAEWLTRPGMDLTNPSGLMPARYFSVAVNSQVARTLAPEIPNEVQLARALGSAGFGAGGSPNPMPPDPRGEGARR